MNSELVIIHTYNSGKNVKLHIPYVDIIDLHYCPWTLNSMTSGPDGHSYPRRSSSLIGDGIGTALVITHKDHKEKTVQVSLLADFGTDLDYKRIKSLWFAAQVNAPIFEEDWNMINWHGKSHGAPKDLFIWIITNSQVVFCSREHPMAQNIKLFQIIDLVYDHKSENGNIKLKYVCYSKDGNMNSNSEKIIEKDLLIEEFGSINDFESLACMWRQASQSRLIEDVFGETSYESRLFRYVISREDPLANSEIERQKIPTAPGRFLYVSPYIYKDDLIHADSMRRVLQKSHSNLDVTVHQPETFSTEFRSDQFLRALSEVHLRYKDSSSKNIGYVRNKKESRPKPHYRQRSVSLQQSLVPTNALSPISISDRRRYTISDENKPKSVNRKNISRKMTREKDELFSCLHDYEGKAIEMGFTRENILRIIKKDASGWWYAEKLAELPNDDNNKENLSSRGKFKIVEQGWVPSNFLKPLPNF